MTAPESKAAGSTERAAVESVQRRGYWTGRGKRAFKVAKRMERDGTIPGATYSYSAFNANGSRSQWNHPKFIAAYEVVITGAQP